MLYEYALQRVKGISESFDNALAKKIDSYKDNRIVDLYTTTQVFEIFTSTEGMDGAKELSSDETPPLLDINDGFSVIIEENRFGGAIELKEAEYRREQNDVTTKVDAVLKKKRNKLLIANKALFLRGMFQFLNEAFSGTAKYKAPDGVELCGVHSWKTAGAASWTNKGTAKFSEAAVDAILEYGGAFVDSANNPMIIDFDTFIFKKGSAAAKLARQLFAQNITPTKVADINIYEGEFTIIETPYITNKLNWFARDSKDENGNPLKIGVGEYPTLRDPIRQNNEAIRVNCTGFWKQGIVNMPYSWYGSDGSA